MKPINTERFSERLRTRSVDLEERRLLITNFQGSEQEQDLTEPANCDGYGRIRHFRRSTSEGWPANPLPIDPACRALGFGRREEIRAQVFQNASCNWRCWYCFVDFELLSADPRKGGWLSATELVDLYLAQAEPPPMIDITGGQPDLIPEWVPWMMRDLEARGLSDNVYLWSDDNLSNDYLWRYLGEEDLRRIAEYPAYGRVCCFKGFDEASFHFNTMAEPGLFGRQFALFRRLLSLRIDIYAYVTFTTPTATGVSEAMKGFVDRLQDVHEDLPLRTVPLEVRPFTPVHGRLGEEQRHALENQWRAVEAWERELDCRFSASKRGLSITDVCLTE